MSGKSVIAEDTLFSTEDSLNMQMHSIRFLLNSNLIDDLRRVIWETIKSYRTKSGEPSGLYNTQISSLTMDMTFLGSGPIIGSSEYMIIFFSFQMHTHFIFYKCKTILNYKIVLFSLWTAMFIKDCVLS